MARSDFAFAGDPSSHSAFLFGGLIDSTTARAGADTWLFNFTQRTWTNVTQSTAPPARQDAAFAVAPAVGEAFLYGGWNRNYSGTGALTYADTWALNLSTWAWSPAPTSGPQHPPPLQGASLTWNPVTGRLDLFGGCFPCESAVWQYAPLTGVWSPVPVGGSIPSPRGYPVWAYDPAQQKNVLFGGLGNAGPLNDTFEWDPSSGNWSLASLSPHPSGRYSSAATWMDVPGNESLFLTGGAGSRSSSDLWRLAPVANLSVLVRNVSDLLPIANATVLLNGTGGGLTDTHGYWNITRVTPGEHSIRSIAPGYALLILPHWVAPGTDDRLVLNLTPIPPAQLTVDVADLDGRPIANATVEVFLQGVLFLNPPLVTDISGVVRYTNIPTFPVDINVSALYYHSFSEVVNLTSGADTLIIVQLTAYALAWVHVVGSLPPLSLTVPLFDAQVVAYPNAIGVTDFRGSLFLQMEIQGLTVFTASAAGFGSSQALAFAPYTGLFFVNLTLTSLPFGRLDVRVLDSSNHEPIPLAGVNLTAVAGSPIGGLSVTSLTGVNGYSNTSYPPTNYSVAVEHPGYQPNTSVMRLPVLSADRRSLVVNLTPLPTPVGPGGNSSFHLLPGSGATVWPYLVVPMVLLLAGGAYLSLLRGERASGAALRDEPSPPKPPPPPETHHLPPPPEGE